MDYAGRVRGVVTLAKGFHSCGNEKGVGSVPLKCRGGPDPCKPCIMHLPPAEAAQSRGRIRSARCLALGPFKCSVPIYPRDLPIDA
jgi:hypothetical protein